MINFIGIEDLSNFVATIGLTKYYVDNHQDFILDIYRSSIDEAEFVTILIEDEEAWFEM